LSVSRLVKPTSRDDCRVASRLAVTTLESLQALLKTFSFVNILLIESLLALPTRYLSFNILLVESLQALLSRFLSVYSKRNLSVCVAVGFASLLFRSPGEGRRASLPHFPSFLLLTSPQLRILANMKLSRIACVVGLAVFAAGEVLVAPADSASLNISNFDLGEKPATAGDDEPPPSEPPSTPGYDEDPADPALWHKSVCRGGRL
jgi:hypothetical protein